MSEEFQKTKIAFSDAQVRYLNSRRKRVFDLMLGLVGMAIFLNLFIPVAVATKLNSRGPVFYRQTRVGQNGRTFTIIKLRTMDVGAEDSTGAVWKAPSDARVTAVGSILRKLYLDELPQMINVLRGEMSIVGPRPERPELTELIVSSYPRFADRLAALPGITGLAQIRFPYVSSIEDSRRKLTYDQLYMRNASIFFDGSIVLKTVFRIIKRRGA